MWHVDGLLERNCVLNLLVIGDSDFELDAGRRFKRESSTYMNNQRCLLKLVKFKSDPTPDQLILQLQALDA